MNLENAAAGIETFQIDVRIRMVETAGSDPFCSFCFKGKGWTFLNFGISKDQRFAVRERLAQNQPFKIWKTGSLSNIEPDDWNVLTIRRFEGRYYFFVNGVLAADFDSLPESGDVCGFFAPGKSRMLADDVVLKTWRF